jgi:iron complex transport system substrate-binding protein
MRNQMQIRKLLFVPCLILLVVLAGCASAALTTPTSSAAESPTTASLGAAAPGPIVVHHVSGQLQLDQPATRVITCSEEAMDFPAVRGGRAYRVNAEHWMSFGGLRSAHAVLDDLERYLAESRTSCTP